MSILKILTHTDMILGKKAALVEDIQAVEIQKLIDDLIVTSYNTGGHGLAAPQVGVDQQIFVYRKNPSSIDYKVVANPIVVFFSGKVNSKREGCLSVPGVTKDVRRYRKFALDHLDRYGKKTRLNSTNKLEVTILQHEFDHLMGLTLLNR